MDFKEIKYSSMLYVVCCTTGGMSKVGTLRRIRSVLFMSVPLRYTFMRLKVGTLRRIRVDIVTWLVLLLNVTM